MRGFNLNNEGLVTSIAPEWEPEVVSERFDEETGEIVEVVVEVGKPENTVYPDNFDEIVANLNGPPEQRLQFFFNNDVQTTQPDPAAEAYLEAKAEQKELDRKIKELVLG